MLPYFALSAALALLAPDCPAQLAWASSFAERNYAGFADKVTAATRPAYDSLLTTLRADAARAEGDAACDAVLRRWTAFFRDGHLSVSRRGAAPFAAGATLAAPTSDDAVRARFASWERAPLDEAAARARIAARGAARDPIEGIWESFDGRYRTAVVRDPQPGRDYTMAILRADSVWWTPGQVKATFARDTAGAYRVRFFMRDHSEQQWTVRPTRNVLPLPGLGAWVRRWPEAADDVTAEGIALLVNARFTARELAPGTVLVQVPTFADPRGIDSLFAAEGARIRAAERLVIDVRGNGGGSDYNFRELLPLIYTNPVRMVSIMALATDENIAAEEAMAADTTYPAAQRAQIRRNADRMREKRGGWLVYDDYEQRQSAVLDRPREVAVIVDRGCASSCEQFILTARQSTKVTIYGDRSAGVLDYGNVRRADMPGSNLSLHRPITRSKRLPKEPVDNVGIPPHVVIPAGEPSPVEWVLRRMGAADR